MNKKRFFLHGAAAVILFLAAASFFPGCSFPRIIILRDPLSMDEHVRLGKIYATQGKPDLAEQQYLAALEKEPESISALVLLGDLSFQTKKYPQAEKAYTKAIKIQPDNGDLYNNLCWVYLEQNIKIDETDSLIGKALTMTPEHRAYFLDTKGVVLMRQGKITDAIGTFRNAIELLPADNAAYLSEAYRHLSEAYRMAGDSVRALEAEQAADSHRPLQATPQK